MSSLIVGSSFTSSRSSGLRNGPASFGGPCAKATTANTSRSVMAYFVLFICKLERFSRRQRRRVPAAQLFVPLRQRFSKERVHFAHSRAIRGLDLGEVFTLSACWTKVSAQSKEQIADVVGDLVLPSKTETLFTRRQFVLKRVHFLDVGFECFHQILVRLFREILHRSLRLFQLFLHTIENAQRGIHHRLHVAQFDLHFQRLLQFVYRRGAAGIEPDFHRMLVIFHAYSHLLGVIYSYYIV